MKRGSGCCAVDIYRTAALTSFSNSIKLHNIFIFGMAYWMNPEFENCLLQDFKFSDMGMNLLRVINTVGMQINYRLNVFVHFTTQLKNLILLVALVTFGFKEF